VIDFVYWFAFAIFQTTFALFTAAAFNSTRHRRDISSARLCSGRDRSGGLIRPVVHRLGDKPTFIVGCCARLSVSLRRP